MSNGLNVEKGSIVNNYADGSVRRFTLADGYTFEAYVPNNLATDTSIMIYEHGDRAYYTDWKYFTEKFASDGCSSIVIRADRYRSMELYNHVVEQYNLEPEQRMTVSFSGGTPYAMDETVELIKQAPDAEPPISVILDGYVPSNFMLRNGNADILKENNGILLAFRKRGDTMYTNQYKTLAKAGVNIVIFTDKSRYGDSHRGINVSFTEGDLMEYVLGEGELPNRYEITVYDNDEKQFVSLDYSQVSELEKIYEYYGIDTFKIRANKLSSLKYYQITSDNNVVNGYLNNIIRRIKENKFLELSFSSGLSSTTNVPNSIPDSVKQYFNSATKMLMSLAKFTDAISQIDPTYQETDKRMQKYIDELDKNIL